MLKNSRPTYHSVLCALRLDSTKEPEKSRGWGKKKEFFRAMPGYRISHRISISLCHEFSAEAASVDAGAAKSSGRKVKGEGKKNSPSGSFAYQPFLEPRKIAAAIHADVFLRRRVDPEQGGGGGGGKKKRFRTMPHSQAARPCAAKRERGRSPRPQLLRRLRIHQGLGALRLHRYRRILSDARRKRKKMDFPFREFSACIRAFQKPILLQTKEEKEAGFLSPALPEGNRAQWTRSKRKEILQIQAKSYDALPLLLL